MTDCLDNMLTSMVNTFNSDCLSNAEVDLTDDKTLKWRNLSKNQFARKDKDKKACVKSMTTPDNKQPTTFIKKEPEEQTIKKEIENDRKKGGEMEKLLYTEENLEQSFKELMEEDEENIKENSPGGANNQTQLITTNTTNIHNINKELTIKVENNANPKEIATKTKIVAQPPTTTNNTKPKADDECSLTIASSEITINIFSPSRKTLVVKTPTTTMPTSKKLDPNINRKQEQNIVNENQQESASTTTSSSSLSTFSQPSKEPHPNNITNSTVKEDNEEEKKQTANNYSATKTSNAQTLINNNQKNTSPALNPSTNTINSNDKSITINNNDNDINNTNTTTNKNYKNPHNGATKIKRTTDANESANISSSVSNDVGDVVNTVFETKEVPNSNNSTVIMDIKTDGDVNYDVKCVENLIPVTTSNIGVEASVQKPITDLDELASNNTEDSKFHPLPHENKLLFDKQQQSTSKRGRGRTKKYATTDLESNTQQQTSTTITSESPALERHSSPINNERKLTRKRKNAQDDENEMGSLVVKSEEDGSKRTRRSERLCNRLDGFKIFEEEKEAEENRNNDSNDSPTRKTLRLTLDVKTPPKKRGHKAKGQVEAEKLHQQDTQQITPTKKYVYFIQWARAVAASQQFYSS